MAEPVVLRTAAPAHELLRGMWAAVATERGHRLITVLLSIFIEPI
jgi:hypothetical protein